MVELDRLGMETYLEIGPKPILTTLGRQCVPAGDQAWLPSLRPGRDDWTQMLASLADLYLRGATIDWEGLWDTSELRVNLNSPDMIKGNGAW